MTKALGALAASRAAALENAHRGYVATISSPEAAVSLQLAGLLGAWCELFHPKRVLDLGSGFSSFVFGRYAVKAGAFALSVDDQPEWIERSKGFLEGQGLDPGQVIHLDDLGHPEPFDLVFMDLSSDMAVRKRVTPAAIGLTAKAIVLDDAQKIHVRDRFEELASESGLAIFSLRNLTKDDFGRYALIAIREGEL
jgi:hypothetical protein